MRKIPCTSCPYMRQENSSDHGPAPFAADIARASQQNTAFRTAFWTGCHLQMTLMCIPVNGDIGVEIHEDTDQFIRVEEGQCKVLVGSCRERLDMQQSLRENCGVFIPAGTWHNVVNTGSCPLKLSSVYAPPEHPRGTVHQTKADAQRAE